MNSFLNQKFYFLTIGIFFHITLILTSQPSPSKDNTPPNNDTSKNNDISCKNDIQSIIDRILNAVESMDQKQNTEIKRVDDKHTALNKTLVDSVAEQFLIMDSKVKNNETFTENFARATRDSLTNLNCYSTKEWTTEQIIALENKTNSKFVDIEQKVTNLDGRVNQKNNSNHATVDLSKYVTKEYHEARTNDLYKVNEILLKDNKNSSLLTAESTWEFVKNQRAMILLLATLGTAQVIKSYGFPVDIVLAPFLSLCSLISGGNKAPVAPKQLPSPDPQSDQNNNNI
jgi:hypothetical protein